MIKSVIKLILFIVYFILISYLPLIIWVLFVFYFTTDITNIFTGIISTIIILLSILTLFKIQWLFLYIPVLKIINKPTNILPDKIFKNIKIADKIMLSCILIDVLVIIINYNLICDTFNNIWFYIIYLSFSSNYLIIYHLTIENSKLNT